MEVTKQQQPGENTTVLPSPATFFSRGFLCTEDNFCTSLSSPSIRFLHMWYKSLVQVSHRSKLLYHMWRNRMLGLLKEVQKLSSVQRKPREKNVAGEGSTVVFSPGCCCLVTSISQQQTIRLKSLLKENSSFHCLWICYTKRCYNKDMQRSLPS
jgi:hypothetical protein